MVLAQTHSRVHEIAQLIRWCAAAMRRMGDLTEANDDDLMTIIMFDRFSRHFRRHMLCDNNCAIYATRMRSELIEAYNHTTAVATDERLSVWRHRLVSTECFVCFERRKCIFAPTIQHSNNDECLGPSRRWLKNAKNVTEYFRRNRYSVWFMKVAWVAYHSFGCLITCVRNE